ncbi:MAG: branched-chain amino acid ABC transporter permease [Clostridiales bacterium]|nr:branched-chain amino acid ABC transporter permease [Clostridiales bacterium]
MIQAISVTGLALFTGFTGMMSLGHAAFIAIGAYTAAICTKTYGLSFFLSIPLAACMAGLASLIIGIPTLRAKLRSDYFTIATLGFGEAVRVTLENLSITNGARGIANLTKYSTLPVALIALVIIIFIAKNFVFSRYGRMAIALREDYVAAEMAGINLFNVRLRSLFISAVFAGVGGAFHAHYICFIQPNMFTNVQSTMLTAAVVAGGIGSLTGPVIAAILFASIPEILRAAEMWRLVVYGGVLVAIMVLRPQGIFGYREFSQLFRKRTAGSAGEGEASE